MQPGKRKWSVLLGALYASVLAAPTDRYEELTGEEDDFQAERPEWHEQRGALAPLPAADQWQPVRLDRLPQGQQAYLAPQSLSIGKDAVVRFWFSVRSSGGGRLVEYDGLHCGQRKYVVYAYAHPGRQPPVKPLRQPRWRDLSDRGGQAWRFELARDVLCSGEVPRTPRQIGQAIRGRYEQMNPWDNWTNDD